MVKIKLLVYWKAYTCMVYVTTLLGRGKVVGHKSLCKQIAVVGGKKRKGKNTSEPNLIFHDIKVKWYRFLMMFVPFIFSFVLMIYSLIQQF